jgi:prolyl oligopeptidase
MTASAFASGPATTPNMPQTEKRPVKETLHGVEIIDNYRWLEGDNSDPKQMGKVNDEVGKWTDAQNAYTRSILDNLPGRSELESKIRPLMEIGSVSTPRMRGNKYFYSRREGTQSQSILYVREGYKGADKLLIDPTKIAADGLTTLAGSWPSHDGKLLAYGTYRSGDENTTVYIMDVDTGKMLPDVVPGKVQSVEWMPDASGFFYRNLSDVKNPYSGQIMFHKLGTPVTEDKLLFRQYTPEENKKLATTWGPSGNVDTNCKWMVLTYWTGTSSNDIWIVNLDHWRKTGEFKQVEISVGADATFAGNVVDDVLYVQTNHNAPNYKVIAIDPNKPDKANWKDLIPEKSDAVLQSFSVAKGVIVADYMAKAMTKIELLDLSGKLISQLKLPQDVGSGGVATEEDRTEAYLSFTSYNYPPSIFKVDLAKPDAQPELWERPAVPVDPTIAEVKQATYISKDGTPVTMFIVHKKGLKLDGTNPTILNGYGGFNISMQPGFSATIFPWIEAGGIYAVPNLRGGGEYGKNWHEAGMLGRKQNVFDDMISAAEFLVREKYTNPQKLATTGGSNGGLLMGAMMTQRPDLFKAIICAVPLLDMVRYQDFLMARYWVPEYGDAVANKEHFQWIHAYSPYHRIKQGTKYPAILFTAGENDTRVHPLHARKMAAAMQAATASDQKDQPVLCWVDRDAGHGQGKPLNLRIRDVVDQRIFIMWQLGMLNK